jgi:hypothetical protein
VAKTVIAIGKDAERYQGAGSGDLLDEGMAAKEQPTALLKTVGGKPRSRPHRLQRFAGANAAMRRSPH